MRLVTTIRPMNTFNQSIARNKLFGLYGSFDSKVAALEGRHEKCSSYLVRFSQ